jgi:arylsulfatase A-like enzyme
MLVVHPQFSGGQRCLETTSHLDIVPTVVAMTGKSTAPVADTMARMKGKDLTPLLGQPVNPAFSQARGGVLFCYSQLMVHDPKFTAFLYETLLNKANPRTTLYQKIEQFPIDWSLRVAIRSVTDERYRFTRYFPFRGFNLPQTLDDLRANNDLELYDLRNDPDEVVNLARDFDAHRDLIAAMNAKLNALITSEIGVDDGSFMHLDGWVDWDKAGPGSLNL